MDTINAPLPQIISSQAYAQQSGKLSELQMCEDTFCYLESRPSESGRNVLMICQSNNDPVELLPAPSSVRTRAHEYGGGSYLLTQDYIFYSLDSDQNIYCFNRQKNSHSALTHYNQDSTLQYRFSDFCFDSKRQRLIAICEDFSATMHKDEVHHPTSNIVVINLMGDSTLQVLVSGADFYSNPRLNPSGTQLSYLCWNHPSMPWESSYCYCADLDREGNIVSTKKIAGGPSESIFQPQWSPNGELFLVSDKNNWWNIYQYTEEGLLTICEMAAEFATPQWVFGMSSYAFLNANKIICCYSQDGKWNLGIINLPQKNLLRLNPDNGNMPFQDISSLCAHNNKAFFLGGTSTQPITLWSYQLEKMSRLDSKTVSLIVPNQIASAKAIQFPTFDGDFAHAFFYEPINFSDTNVLPPLLVMCHGGPTGATESSLSLKIQFWTSRGYAVVDVNYRGSTGFGRSYRNKLKNYWGIKDVIDVCSAANYLIEQKCVDKNRVVIRGSSAGGFTVLAALSFGQQYISTQVFRAGCSLYGIGDLEALARDTHKFEAHYLDQLIGGYPKEVSTYRERSPLYHLENFNCPVIFFQGLKDKVVPPNQAMAMVDALRSKSIRADYVTFEDEGHGFRNANNVQQAIEQELAFYESVFNSTSHTQSN